MKAAYPSLANQSKRRIQRRHRFLYKGSPVQLYCKYVNEYYIKENDTLLPRKSFDENLRHKDGWLQIEKEM
jgi:phage FluMu protein Com